VLKFICTVGLFFVAFCCAAGAAPKLLSQQLLDDGWISLFDGETQFGWQPTGDAKWEIVDGEIHTSGDKAGFLMTTTEWAEYLLHIEFKASERTNSGVFLQTPLEPKDPARDCYELNIAPADNPFPTGSFVGRQKVVRKAKWQPAADDWHSFDVAVLGGEFAIRLDGKSALQYSEAKPLRMGHIGLQSREGKVAFRNVRLKPMGLQPLLNGRDLDGWSKERAEKCQFQVTSNGELHLSHGPGQIETVRDYTNFVLQLECKVNGSGLNSGIFFRTLHKGRWAGYESQIQNSFLEGDRTKPKDAGTGAIYRRQAARRVVADDKKWFAKTIVAEGPHFAAWVNGYQVTDFIDRRPEKESGREGLRLGGGAIAIQGHDGTSDFLFRKIGVVELPR
jgi:Domain of Unknown Function (DUF1080)